MEVNMNKRILGRTGLEVTQLGLGGLFVSSIGGQFEESRKAALRALDLGVNFVDTAPSYFNSEEVLGKIMESNTKPLILSTKLGGRPQPFLPQDKGCLMKSVEESLRLLKRDFIDIMMVHEPDRPAQFDWWTDPEEVHGPVLELLHTLKKDGVIGHIGLGGTTAYEIVPLIKSGKFEVLITAFNYSLLWREAELEILPAAKAMNMGIIIGSPLQQGALAARYDEYVDDPGRSRWLSSPRRRQLKALYAFLDEIGEPIAEVGLRFVISNPDITCVLMGPRSVSDVDSSFAAIEKGPLPRQYVDRINLIAAMVPFRPYEEPFNLPFVRPYKGPGPATGAGLK
jgi:aryl-alcohol dehydrogenase-like predicted oxidoreductase